MIWTPILKMAIKNKRADVLLHCWRQAPLTFLKDQGQVFERYMWMSSFFRQVEGWMRAPLPNAKTNFSQVFN